MTHHSLESITPHSSKYHTSDTTLLKAQDHPLQSTASPSSKYHITLFKVPHHPLQSTTSPFSKYSITLFKVPHHYLVQYLDFQHILTLSVYE